MGNAPPQHKQIRYPTGLVYDGMVSGTKRQGPGTLTWPDGATYTGDWVNDEMHGNGVIKFPNHSEYSGAFSHNNPYGMGTLRTINGEKLTGQWQFQGRSVGPYGPVGKYYFSGDVYGAEGGDNEKKRTFYSGPLSLHLTTGLVALPAMQDPRDVVWAAVVEAAEASGMSAEDKKLMAEQAGAVPPATVVADSAPSAPSSLAYGYQDPALLPKHADDHGSYNVLDPRLWLGSLGVGPGAPSSYNVKERNDRIAQQRGGVGPAVPIATATATPVVAVQGGVPVAQATAVPGAGPAERSGVRHNVVM